MSKFYILPDQTYMQDDAEVNRAVLQLERELLELFPKYRLVAWDFSIGSLHLVHRELNGAGNEIEIDSFKFSVKALEDLKVALKREGDAYLQPLFDLASYNP